MNWQPIETAPKDGTMFLVWPGDEEHATAYWEDGVWRLCCCCANTDAEATHWMPLPPAPAQVTGNVGEVAMIAPKDEFARLDEIVSGYRARTTNIYSLRDSDGVCWYVGKTEMPKERAQSHARKWPHLKMVVLMTRVPDIISGEIERALIFAMSQRGSVLNEKIPKAQSV